MKIWGGTVKSYMINLFKYIPIFSQKFPVCVMFVGRSSLVVCRTPWSPPPTLVSKQTMTCLIDSWMLATSLWCPL